MALSQVKLVYHGDIVIFAGILFFILLNVPRAFARLSRKSGWTGFSIYSVPQSQLGPSKVQIASNPVYMESKKEVSTDQTVEGGEGNRSVESFTEYNALPALPKNTIPLSASADGPRHIPMLSTLVHPVAAILAHRVHEGYSLGQVLIMVAWLAVLAYVSFYKAPSLFYSSERLGFVAVSQVPFVYVLATKNNVLGMLVGVGYEKLNYLHRFLGRTVVLIANIHGIGYMYKWTLTGIWVEKLRDPQYYWGMTALVAFDILFFLSVSAVRSKSYNLFWVSHFGSLIVVLPALYYHKPSCIPYVIAACVFYGLDHLVRTLKTRLATARVRPLPELGITRVEIPNLNAGWRAGQHVRLRVLDGAMGWFGWSEVHPFTVASVARTPEGMVLMCKKAGRWTQALYGVAAAERYGGEGGKEVGRDVRVMVEGPYGGVGNTVVGSYSGAMIVVGGSGVTFALSAVQDLVQMESASHVRTIDIIWSITDPIALNPMLPAFASLIAQSTTARIRVSVFYTRAVTRAYEQSYLPPGMTLTPGRPRLTTLLEGTVSDTMSMGGARGVFVGVCGPTTLANSVSASVKGFDIGLRKAVGGVELHEEVFGW
ncbi:hypothetical protein CONPUDRAFT_85160 [Coniophora puteana RWD-64-598 SS2]|uniref:ferric-chelate reductase (NADPH) n=1 Tax=Coniophora puteana (strain RWD-64-598) TaxID=741705 RepID=A0A5M3MBC2_CONPW|nr:uncharacterized protein CONPUDRAFT_85160 [Coniophora puteana RWD-64-598 SS2]EIW75935.1 hypothetical protein CONPUDRAFT_85160 [Coniophora puteana RWD-64-598 SS2]